MAYSKEIFDQLGRPHGDIGATVLDRLNVVNVNINSLALDVLGNDAGADVLEIGFGGGALIADGLRRFPRSTFHGAEISDLAVERGLDAFSNEILENRVSLHRYDGQILPFDPRTFDTVIAVNVIYFVPQAPVFLAELRRVLKPGGRCVLGFAEGSPDRVTRFERTAVEELLESAGFDRTSTETAQDEENGVFHCTLGYVSREAV